TPRCVIDPRISPGSNPIPMAGVIRRPAIGHVRVPDVAVTGIVAPVTVGIKVFAADNVGSKITSRRRLIVTAIASVSPVVERVRAADIFDVRVQRIGSAESALLSGVERVGLAVTGGLASAVAQGDDGAGAIFARVQAVKSGLRNRK